MWDDEKLRRELASLREDARPQLSPGLSGTLTRQLAGTRQKRSRIRAAATLTILLALGIAWGVMPARRPPEGSSGPGTLAVQTPDRPRDSAVNVTPTPHELRIELEELRTEALALQQSLSDFRQRRDQLTMNRLLLWRQQATEIERENRVAFGLLSFEQEASSRRPLEVRPLEFVVKNFPGTEAAREARILLVAKE